MPVIGRPPRAFLRPEPPLADPVGVLEPRSNPPRGTPSRSRRRGRTPSGLPQSAGRGVRPRSADPRGVSRRGSTPPCATLPGEPNRGSTPPRPPRGVFSRGSFRSVTPARGATTGFDPGWPTCPRCHDGIRPGLADLPGVPRRDSTRVGAPARGVDAARRLFPEDRGPRGGEGSRARVGEGRCLSDPGRTQGDQGQRVRRGPHARPRTLPTPRAVPPAQPPRTARLRLASASPPP